MLDVVEREREREREVGLTSSCVYGFLKWVLLDTLPVYPPRNPRTGNISPERKGQSC